MFIAGMGFKNLAVAVAHWQIVAIRLIVIDIVIIAVANAVAIGFEILYDSCFFPLFIPFTSPF